ncbi:MAG: acetyl-CoA carboxylase biotin carboxylase subunit [Luminiphilus sp.]
MSAIQTLLVANRGEIAVRVMRTAKSMGLKTVAVYSDADANALHVRSADLAVPLGGNTAAESYLNGDAILEAARTTGADAIHPGYGFLSENTGFAAACAEAGIIFIGPPAAAVEIMGDKALAKRAMLEAKVPCIPGYQGEDQSDDTLSREAQAMGMPVMIKAAAGGGGRGMRRVADPEQLLQSIALARSEAEGAFGNGDLILERAIEGARHVEVQVFADTHGNVIHLGERDCSLQRRHQKVVEESPCPIMTPALREAMGLAAVEAARAVKYVGAGTVEFLLDASGDFYFLEMNTRLQVEHPVTECVTGVDLVQWQIRVAQGEPLPATQDDIDLFGHAIEVRLCAEDPAAAFLPSAGPVSLFSLSPEEGVRMDAGIETGDAISPFYDSMVAKVIAWGETRETARLKLRSALQATTLAGVTHNRAFLLELLDQPTFIKGGATTDYIDQHYPEGFSPAQPGTASLAAGVVLQQILAAEQHFANALSVSEELRGWVSTGPVTRRHTYEVGDATFTADITSSSAEQFSVTLMEATHSVTLQKLNADRVAFLFDGQRVVLGYYQPDAAVITLATDQSDVTLTNTDLIPPESAEDAQGGKVQAPMHGQLVSLLVEAEQLVEKDQRLAVFEAMKMQHEILAPVSGVVQQVNSQVGQQMAAGDVIMVIEEADGE